jgi:hypothetical protein
VLSASLLLSATLVAQSAAPRPGRTLKYLTAAQIDPSRLLPPPPADGSRAQQEEMAAVKTLIRSRTPERFAQAKWDAEHENATLFASTLGPAFDLAKLPATARLLEAVQNDQAIAASMAKDFFKRKFPVTAAVPEAYNEWTCDAGDHKPASRGLRSYPSGHATLGYSMGGVLAALIPEKSQAILARAADYAYSREVCGDHYHSDVEASHALGNALAVLFLNNEGLKPLVDAARAELARSMASSYRVAQTYALGGDGSWDYIVPDPQGHRVFVGRQNRVMVVDEDTGALLGEVAGINGAHGTAIATSTGHGFATSGNDQAVVMFDLKTYGVLGRIHAAEDADAIIYDAVSNRVFTFNGDAHSSTVIEPKAGTMITNIALGGKPEYGVSAGDGKVYANLTDTSEVVEIDAKSATVTRRWSTAPCKQPVSMAIDTAHHRLFSGCRSGVMAVSDYQAGGVVSTLPIGAGVDGAGFDPSAADAFFSNADGTLTVVHQDGPDQYRIVQTIETPVGSRNLGLDPLTHRLYVASAKFGPPANGRGRGPVLPGSFALMVIGR